MHTDVLSCFYTILLIFYNETDSWPNFMWPTRDQQWVCACVKRQSIEFRWVVLCLFMLYVWLQFRKVSVHRVMERSKRSVPECYEIQYAVEKRLNKLEESGSCRNNDSLVVRAVVYLPSQFCHFHNNPLHLPFSPYRQQGNCHVTRLTSSTMCTYDICLRWHGRYLSHLTAPPINH